MTRPPRTDYRTQASRDAEARVLAMCGQGVVLGLGGGPSRAHSGVTNLNIAPHENVEVVGDAHLLPLADNCVHAVHCEAVFEHLEDPHDAAGELFRVMQPGGLAYICTPFLQPFHGYPSHFQNFTHLGQKRLFERAGFTVLEHGVCVGPAWATSTIIAAFIAQYTPRLIRWPARALWYGFSHLFVRPLDRWLSSRPDAYVVASTTYVLVEKANDAPA